MSTGRVLLLDSDPASSALISRGFSVLGVELKSVGAVSTGASVLHRRTPDLIIVTDRCEGRSGLDAVRAMHALAPDVPMVFAPTFSAPRTQRRAIELGAAAVVDQPCELAELLSVSSQWLANDTAGAHAS